MVEFRPNPDDLDRALIKAKIRENASKFSYPLYQTQVNSDEHGHAPEYPLNFTKGLPHDEYGIVNPGAYEMWVAAINEEYLHGATLQDFSNIPTGEVRIQGTFKGAKIPWRGWESPRSGHAYDLMGPDSAEVAMPPAPYLGSDELIAEMAEVYAMALLRDYDFVQIQDGGQNPNVNNIITMLNKLSWFSPNRPIKSHTLFRGSTVNACQGPYISQFLLQGPACKGLIKPSSTVPYGSLEINLKSEQLAPNEDFMTTWPAWLDIQQGADASEPSLMLQKPMGVRRLIQTPRDLARYVQIDALYQAYQIATLTLLDPVSNTPIQSGFPSGKRGKPRASFATFGGPHILSLVTEVATRALRAVRRQKFNHHRRGRPERIGAMLTLASHGLGHKLGNAQMGVELMLKELERIGIADEIDQLNKKQNAALPSAVNSIPEWTQHPSWWLKKTNQKNLLLPMAFIEGSPMHPSYGAGHATVAGACVTMIKCFFQLVKGMMPRQEMLTLADIKIPDILHNTSPRVTPANLTVNDELDKLAANISIGRNMAGVHFATDYTESVRMGERVAVGLVAEQLLTYGEPVSILIETFDGDRLRMHTNGTDFPRDVHFDIVTDNGQTIKFNSWWTRHTRSSI